MEINSWLHSRNSDETAGAGVFTVLLALGLLIVSGWGCEQHTVADHLAMGDREMSEGKLADAEHEYQTAIQIAPNDVPAHVALAGLYASEQKAAMAQQEHLKALELDPNNPSAHAALAADYTAQSQLAMAEEQYRAAIALEPATAKTHLELGSVLASENDPGAAEAELRTAIGLAPNNAQGHFRLANLLSTESGRQQEAQSEYQQARDLDPGLAIPGAPSTAPPTASTASAAPALKEVNKKFLLTKNSQVFEQPEETSRVVGKVHRRKFVRVTAIDGDWLRVQLRSGTVGFIPVSAAE